jgi:hypothetical protein
VDPQIAALIGEDSPEFRLPPVHSPLSWALAGLASAGLVSGVTATGPVPVPVPELGAVVAVGAYWTVMRRPASVIPVVIGLLLAVPLFAAARRRGNLVPVRRADRRNR